MDSTKLYRRKATSDDKDLREQVLSRDRHACRYCGDKRGPFHLDHVYPDSKGGETSVDNLVTACVTCNQKKHAKVGIWPKPIGYFEKKPDVSIANVLIFSFSAACFANGFMDISSGFDIVGKWSLIVGFIVLNAGLLKLALGR